MNKLVVLPLVGFLLFLFCSDSSNPIAPASDNFRYPLQTGKTWVYSRTVISKPNNSDKKPDSTFYSVEVKVMGPETIFDSLSTIKVKESVNGAQTALTNYNYYQPKGETLYLAASIGSGLALPKTTARFPFLHSLDILHPLNFLQHMSDADSIYRHNPPKPVLQYPLSPGKEWSYSQAGKPRRANKRVVGETQVSTPAGTFDVVQIQWLLDFDGDGSFDDNVEYFDYIAEQGLVKRSFLVKNLPLVDDSGTYIGSYNFYDKSELQK